MALLAATGIALCVSAAAETSSWSGRVDGPAEAIPKQPAPAKPAPPGTQVKIIRTVPNTPMERPAIAPPALGGGAAASTQAPFETQLKPSSPATASAAGASEYA